jgi:hypothetical protein
MKATIKRIFRIVLLLLLAGCEKQVDWPLDGPPQNKVIVDGIITDQRGAQKVILTYPVSSLNESPQPVTGAIVRISAADSTWQLNEQTSGTGIYLTDSLFMATPGKIYTLFIYATGKVYSAQASMEPGSFFPELIYSRNTDDSLFHIDYVASAFSSENPAMWELLIDWSSAPGYQDQDPETCRARMLFYTLPTLDVSEIFAPLVEKISFPAGTFITQRRYSLTSGHAEFLREMLLETSWTGGFFNQAPANVSTNLSAGASGYFGACAVTSLSVPVTN